MYIYLAQLQLIQNCSICKLVSPEVVHTVDPSLVAVHTVDPSLVAVHMVDPSWAAVHTVDPSWAVDPSWVVPWVGAGPGRWRS